MTDRSYLYSTDRLPTAVEPVPARVRCISEHDWSVPLAHKLVVGHGTQVVESGIFGGPIAIAGGYTQGAGSLVRLLRLVGEGKLAERDLFDRQLDKVEEHLKRQQATYFLLEVGEILHDLSDVRLLVEQQIPEATRLTDAVLAGGERRQLAALRKNWRDHFDSFYSDYLYYTPPDTI
jgi:hypothetical protein